MSFIAASRLMRRPPATKPLWFGLVILLALTTSALAKRPLTFEDLMRFRQIHGAVISDDGEWIACAAIPDRGDGEGIVRHASKNIEYHVPRGTAPQIAANGKWVAFKVEVPFAEQKRKGEKDAKKDDAKKHGGDESKPGLALLRTADGWVEEFARVQSFSFSQDGRWLAVLFEVESRDDDAKAESEGAGTENSEDDEKEKPRKAGGTLRLRNLATEEDRDLTFVKAYAFDETSTYLAYTVATESGEENGLFLVKLGAEPVALQAAAKAAYPQMQWAKNVARLAYLVGDEEKEGTVTGVTLHLWEPSGERILASRDDAPEGWEIPAENTLVFSDDAQRLFFGFKPAKKEANVEMSPAAETQATTTPDTSATATIEGAQTVETAQAVEATEQAQPDSSFDPYDREALLEQVSLDVWHWNDPRIKTNARKEWEKESKRTYRAVVHLQRGTVVPLADEAVPDVEVSQNGQVTLASSNLPYLQEITWDDAYRDLYLVDLDDGSRKELVHHLRDGSSLSPGGKYVLFYRDANWELVDTATGRTRNLTADLGVPFANEDHDYPMAPPGYGLGGWMEGDAAVLIYDKYDIWQFPTAGGEPLCLTAGLGRREETQYRILDLDPDDPYVKDPLLLRAYRDKKKNHAFFRGHVGKSGVKLLREEEKLFDFKAKAKHADRVLYTEESYTEFPDLWVSDLDFEHSRKRTEVNPQIDEFAWGTSELVEWNSSDGIPLQGVLIKPGNYEKGKRYPVLVYFYRFFSQRLHEFNEPVVNHRPSFPMFASNGYCVFLPDVRFDVGTPGRSAVKCLVPGVQKLIDMGIADPRGIGLHGHSWSGYQAAYVITETNMFAACLAGAPVSNMTSAYSGIRLGSGLARQFQYEKSQSRIGGSLWEKRDLYIENSPVFFADRIETPLVIEFGDEDDAVPWHQGVELYLAMRRLRKPCVFLQYRGEPHHLKKYPNKLDYSIKMMQFFDHFCKGAPAPEWWTQGAAYHGDD